MLENCSIKSDTAENAISKILLQQGFLIDCYFCSSEMYPIQLKTWFAKYYCKNTAHMLDLGQMFSIRHASYYYVNKYNWAALFSWKVMNFRMYFITSVTRKKQALPSISGDEMEAQLGNKCNIINNSYSWWSVNLENQPCCIANAKIDSVATLLSN